MKPKEAVGIAVTLIAVIVMLYELFYVNLTGGAIGVSGAVTTDAALLSAAFIMILIGPWLWLGDAPVAVKKLVEARTGRKL